MAADAGGRREEAPSRRVGRSASDTAAAEAAAKEKLPASGCLQLASCLSVELAGCSRREAGTASCCMVSLCLVGIRRNGWRSPSVRQSVSSRGALPC